MFNSLSEAKKTISVLRDKLQATSGQIDTEIFSIIDALQQLFDIAIAINQQNQILTTDEVSDIGEQGLSLLDNLIYKIQSQIPEDLLQDIKHLTVVQSQWVINHRGSLSNIQAIVDELAYLSNIQDDHAILTQLAVFMGQVANACSDVLKHDLDNTNSARPWRVLNINRGIVATRTHDLDVMHTVFPEMIQAIPMDAPEFFEQGMLEMVKLNYPPPVRKIMQEYYERTKLPVVH